VDTKDLPQESLMAFVEALIEEAQLAGKMVVKGHKHHTYPETLVSNSAGISWHLKTWLYRAELKQFQNLLRSHNVPLSAQEALTPKGFRQVALKLHPDKGGNTQDFVFAKSLQQKLNQPIGTITQQLEESAHIIYRASLAIKSLDATVDCVRLYQNQTIENAQKVAVDLVQLYSMYQGIGWATVALNVISIRSSCYNDGLYSALTTVVASTAGLLLPTALMYANPYVAVAYGVGITAYWGYAAVSNAYELYQAMGVTENGEATSHKPSAAEYEVCSITVIGENLAIENAIRDL
jgi:hypothetical protein